MKNIYISMGTGLFSGSDTGEPNWINNTLRSFFSFLDKAAYGLLGIMYELFFNVASAELFTNATIKNFYSRVQLIIGVFMVFKLAITIMQGIVNPDKFTDKNNGFASIITRVVFALVMLTLLVPINIPGAKTEYEIQLNNNGLLFGTLYSLQNRLLSNNTLGRLILGTTDESINTTNNDDDTLSGADKQAESIKKSANVFTSAIFKGFFRINLLPGKDDETKNDNRMCSDIDDDILDTYKQLDASPSELLAYVNEDCKSDGKKRYVFCYLNIISTIVAVIFAFILGGFIVDIAVRAVKLAVLRLIAPIPIISYIEPKQAKEGAFAAWVKALTSTYLDLFLRLAIVYFVIYLIQDIIVNGMVIRVGTGMVGVLSTIFIFIGLFFFARQAPKFIKDVLGLKGPGMSNIGLSAMLAGVGSIRQGGTFREVREAMHDTADMQVEAYNQGKQAPGLTTSYNAGRDHIAKILTGDQNMTGRKMDRGARHLRAMGIDTPNVTRMKNEMYEAQSLASSAADLYDRFNRGQYQESELRTALGTDYNAGDSDDVKRKKLYANKEKLASSAAKTESTYKKVEGMQKQYGQARSFEAQYDARRGNRVAQGIVSHSWGVRREYGHADEYGNRRAIDIPSLQRFRAQDYPNSSTTSANAPQNSSPGGIDMTPPGSTGSGPSGIPPVGGPPPGP